MRKSSTLVFSILVSIAACTPTGERRPRTSVAQRVALVLEAHASLQEIAEGLRAMSDGGCNTTARALVDFEGDLNWSVYETSVEIEPDGETKFGDFIAGPPPPPLKRR